jgi:hypothetical protein
MRWEKNSFERERGLKDFFRRLTFRVMMALMQNNHFDLVIAGFVMVCLASPLAAATLQVEPIPEECEAAAVWEATREQRIEQEFQRRGLFSASERQFNRAEVERVVDERIRALKEMCEGKKKKGP